MDDGDIVSFGQAVEDRRAAVGGRIVDEDPLARDRAGGGEEALHDLGEMVLLVEDGDDDGQDGLGHERSILAGDRSRRCSHGGTVVG